jgi:predicted dehydrogenase
LSHTYRWGIIGPGKIAHVFAQAVKNVPGSSVYAVASRDTARAKSFAEQYQIPVVHDSYELLMQDPNVDIIYISTPHSFHHDQVLKCLERKKPVMCEKPLTTNYAMARQMVDAARAHNVFLMEAMWTRFMPATRKILELIRENAIGEVKYVRGDFGDQFPFDPNSRVYDLKLGGGSILDIGIYPLFLALLVLGKPDAIKSFAHLAKTGADDLASALLYYDRGCIASIMSSTIIHSPITAEIIGTKGMITLDPFWYKTASISLSQPGAGVKRISVPYTGNGFEFQIEEVMQCLDRGAQESDLMPLDFTLLLSAVMDEICQECGISYSDN